MEISFPRGDGTKCLFSNVINSTLSLKYSNCILVYHEPIYDGFILDIYIFIDPKSNSTESHHIFENTLTVCQSDY